MATPTLKEVRRFSSTVVAGVVCMPGGSGKTTFCQKHNNTFDDIDDVWDPGASVESTMMQEWKEAKDVAEQKRLEEECVLYKASKYRHMIAPKAGAMGNHLTIQKIVLCQSYEQAKILLGDDDESSETVTKVGVMPLMFLVPSEELHLNNLQKRGDDDRVKGICGDQRKELVKQESCKYFNDFSQLEKILMEFAQQQGVW